MKQGKDAEKRKAHERGRKREARTHAVGDHAREGAAHHQGNVEQYDEGGDLKGTSAELVGGAADETHKIRGGKAHNKQEICKDKAARGRKERAPSMARTGRHEVSKGLAARRTLPRLGADDASLLCELSSCDPCHECLLG